MKKNRAPGIIAGMVSGCTALILAAFLLRTGFGIVFSAPGEASVTAPKTAEKGDILCVCFPFWSTFTKNADIYLVSGESGTEDEEKLKEIYKVLDHDMLKGQDRVNIHRTDMDRLEYRYSMLRLVLPEYEHRYDENAKSPDMANFHYFRYSGFK